MKIFSKRFLRNSAFVLLGFMAPGIYWSLASEPALPPDLVAQNNLVDINSATLDQLKTLSGIGDAYAKKIIAGRPYTNKTQLVSKKIITQKMYDKIVNSIIARQK